MKKLYVIFIIIWILLFNITPVNAEVYGPKNFEKKYTYEDYWILAHIIGGEGGNWTSWVSDEMCYDIGSVVLNRVESPYFPDTIKDVVWQPGQYAATWQGLYYQEPSERSWRIARELLWYGSKLPEEYVFQAEFRQGSGGFKVQNMYFCYR